MQPMVNKILFTIDDCTNKFTDGFSFLELWFEMLWLIQIVIRVDDTLECRSVVLVVAVHLVALEPPANLKG